jgi:hypothetical protein
LYFSSHGLRAPTEHRQQARQPSQALATATPGDAQRTDLRVTAVPPPKFWPLLFCWTGPNTVISYEFWAELLPYGVAPAEIPLFQTSFGPKYRYFKQENTVISNKFWPEIPLFQTREYRYFMQVDRAEIPLFHARNTVISCKWSPRIPLFYKGF